MARCQVSSSLDERMLSAAKDDNEDLLRVVFGEGGFNINFADGYVSRDVLLELFITSLLGWVTQVMP